VAKDTVTTGVGWMTIEYIYDQMNHAPTAADGPPADVWKKFVAKWEDTTSVDTGDDQFMSFEIVKYRADGSVDPDWDEDDYVDVKDQLSPLLEVVAGHTVARLRCTQLAAYSRAYAPYTDYDPERYYKHFVDAGEPAWVFPMAWSGAGAGNTPPQVAVSMTEETAQRAHWGRTYLPTPAGAYITAAGRLATAYVDAVTNEFFARYNNMQSIDKVPVIAGTMANRVPAHVLMSVDGIRCDDVPDIIRRRRFKHATYHRILPVPGP
jgi:hypothetical protein